MTTTLERPTMTEATPISQHPTRAVIVALAAVDGLLGRVDYSDLPTVYSVDVTTRSYPYERTEANVQLSSARDADAAAAVLAWRWAIPGARVTLTEHGAPSDRYWRAAATIRVGAVIVEVWDHLRGLLTERQAERLERDPQTAYAVLVEIARG